jgi:hypothetical protein
MWVDKYYSSKVWEKFAHKKTICTWEPVAHIYNPSWTQEDLAKGQPGQIVHKTPSPIVTTAEWTGGVIEHLFCKFKLQSHQKKKSRIILLEYMIV